MDVTTTQGTCRVLSGGRPQARLLCWARVSAPGRHPAAPCEGGLGPEVPPAAIIC